MIGNFLVFLLGTLIILARGPAWASGQTQSAVPRQISGQVRLGGQPAAAGVPVVLQIVSSQYAVPADEPEVAHTVTDAKGKFNFDNLEAVGHDSGREFFAVSAKASGYGPAFQVVDLTLVPSGETTLYLKKEAPQAGARQPEIPGSDSDSYEAPPKEEHRSANSEAQLALDRAQELLFRKHDVEASIAELKKAVKLDPWYGPGYILLGVALMQSQRWADAQWAFSEAIKVEPGNAQAFLGLGSAENEQHNYAGAQKALEHSLELAPQSAEAHYELARTFAALGKWPAAEPHVRQAIEINPSYAGPHALMGNIYLEQRDPSFALAEFREYLRLAPQGSLASSIKQIIGELEKAEAQENKQQP